MCPGQDTQWSLHFSCPFKVFHWFSLTIVQEMITWMEETMKVTLRGSQSLQAGIMWKILGGDWHWAGSSRLTKRGREGHSRWTGQCEQKFGGKKEPGMFCWQRVPIPPLPEKLLCEETGRWQVWKYKLGHPWGLLLWLSELIHHLRVREIRW